MGSFLKRLLLIISLICIASCEHSNVVTKKLGGSVFLRNSSYKQNHDNKIKYLESKVLSLYRDNKNNHVIFLMDLLSLGVLRKSLMDKQPYIGEPYHVLKSLHLPSSSKTKYYNIYNQKLNSLKNNPSKVRELLNKNANQKIKEINIFVKKFHRRLIAYKVKSTNPVRVSVAKLDDYLSSKRKILDKMSLAQKLAVLRNSLVVLENIPVALPIKNYRVTSRFRWRWHPIKKKRTMHSGIDLVGKKHSYILATANGRVTFTGRQSGYGKTITIAHAKGSSTLYAHLYDIYVRKGDVVKLGQVIGVQGNTGGSTSDHLHYEVRLKDQRINPEIFQNF